MNRFFLVLIFFSSPLIIFSQDEMTDEEVLRGKEQLKQETKKNNKTEQPTRPEPPKPPSPSGSQDPLRLAYQRPSPTLPV